MIENRDYLQDMNTAFSWITSTLTGLARASNQVSVSLSNVQAHYDLSNEIFAGFLSHDMTYSCPIWLPSANLQSAGVNITDSLEKAQIRKLHRIIDQAKIKASDHVLEIGTGWGSFAIEAVKLTGCHVTSLTLSIEQKFEAESRIAAAGYEKNITVLLKDYRDLSDKEVYDKVVSIEMIEHVGKDHLANYFRIIDRHLKKKGGIAVVQSSVMPESVSYILNIEENH